MTLKEFLVKIGGKVSGKTITFDGPPDVPKNSLTIPLSDLGYSEKRGIFRKSIEGFKSDLEL